jgi:hypothetical protein
VTAARRALAVSAVAFTALTVLAVTDWVAGLDRRHDLGVGWPGAWEGTMHAIWWPRHACALFWIGLALWCGGARSRRVGSMAAGVGIGAWRSRPSSSLAGPPTTALLGAPAIRSPPRIPVGPRRSGGCPCRACVVRRTSLVPPILLLAVAVVAVSRALQRRPLRSTPSASALGGRCGSAGAVVVFSKVSPRIDT